MHFLGVKWDNTTQVPSIAYRDSPNVGDVVLNSLNNDESLTISISKERYCIGGNGPCPDNAVLSSTQFIQCALCRRGDSTYFMSLSGLDNEQVQHLKTVPHLNYINIFGDGTVKTGVAAASRKYKRILEQGATAAIYFTECDGYIARQIERYVSFNLKIKQALSWDTKANLFLKHIDREGAERILDELYFSTVKILSAEYRDCLKKEPEFFYNAYLSDLKTSHTFTTFDYIDKLKAGDTISGKVKGVYGSTLLMETENEYFLSNTNQFLGAIVSMSKKLDKQSLSTSPKKIGLKKPNTEVLSLF